MLNKVAWLHDIQHNNTWKKMQTKSGHFTIRTSPNSFGLTTAWDACRQNLYVIKSGESSKI